MSRCKYCGAEVIFVRDKNGVSILCDADPVYHRAYQWTHGGDIIMQKHVCKHVNSTKEKICRCKSCNAEIKWIKMKTGRSMPVDAKPISYRIAVPGATGTQTLVTPEGRVVSCFFDPGSDLKGYTSHFATCPHAGQHRKR